MTDQQRITQLLEGFLHDRLTTAEVLELQEALLHANGLTQTQAAFQQIISAYPVSAVVNGVDEDAIISKILQSPPPASPVIRPMHRIHFLKTAWFRYAAAVIILFGIGAYLWNTISPEGKLVQHTQPVPATNDVAPGTNRAVLTLSDGSKVELQSGTATITETGTTITNQNGRLEYTAAEQVVYNTMTTPRGGQYQLTLPDGTNVWLNAASSITYPTAFVSNTREVIITGEAYFEVKKNPSKPFVVKTPKEDITVLGTSFNVNAYEDEAFIKTSLLEGTIKVAGKVLQPGQGFVNGKIVKTNVAQDISWKNGEFSFDGLSLQQVMRQLSRWYDVDVVYEGLPPAIRPRGSMGRDLSLVQVLEVLRAMEIQYKLEGRKLVILP